MRRCLPDDRVGAKRCADRSERMRQIHDAPYGCRPACSDERRGVRQRCEGGKASTNDGPDPPGSRPPSLENRFAKRRTRIDDTSHNQIRGDRARTESPRQRRSERIRALLSQRAIRWNEATTGSCSSTCHGCRPAFDGRAAFRNRCFASRIVAGHAARSMEAARAYAGVRDALDRRSRLSGPAHHRLLRSSRTHHRRNRQPRCRLPRMARFRFVCPNVPCCEAIACKRYRPKREASR